MTRDMRKGLEDRIPAGFSALGVSARLTLGGLTGEQIGRLAAGLGVRLSAHGIRRLLEQTEGNPLYFRAPLEEVPASVWEEESPPPPPAPELFARRVRRGLESAPPSTRSLVEAASVLGVRCELQVAAVIGAVEDPLEALEHTDDLELVGSGPAQLLAVDLRTSTPPPVDEPRPPVEQPGPPVEQPRPPARRPSTTVTAKAAKTIRLAGLNMRGLLAKVTVPRRAKISLTLTARLPRAKRVIALSRLSRSTSRATTVSLRLKAGRAVARKLRLALQRRRSVTATLTVTTTLAGGKPSTKTMRMTIRR